MPEAAESSCVISGDIWTTHGRSYKNVTDFFVRNVKFVSLVLLLAFSMPGTGHAFELGLTPSRVYGLWLNIHTVFTEFERQSPSDRDAAGGGVVPRPAIFENKTPSDVYERAKIVRETLAKTLDLGAPPPIPSWIVGYQVLEGRVTDSSTTPSQVFVLSSEVLNSLVEKYIDATEGSRPIARFYAGRDISGKTPSDVYGLVDLLGRRLDAFIALGGTAWTAGRVKQ